MQYAKYFSLLSGKTNAYWVSVHSLKSHEGGILDPDDLICDVCDDREQLAAIYDEQNGGHYHGGGDGMSSASDSDLKESITGSLSSNENLLQVWIFFSVLPFFRWYRALLLPQSLLFVWNQITQGLLLTN